MSKELTINNQKNNTILISVRTKKYKEACVVYIPIIDELNIESQINLAIKSLMDKLEEK